MNNPQLYSASIDERLNALAEEHEAFQSIKMPNGCWGSLNAWAVFLGPSPGGGPDPNEKNVVERPLYWDSTIGMGLTREPFKDHLRRNPRWGNLFFSVVANEDAVSHLTALYNLHWKRTPKESMITTEELDAGCPCIWDMLCLSRPRFVVALTQRTYFSFKNFLQAQKGATVLSNFDEKFPPLQFTLPELQYSSFLVKSPRHPSWPTLNSKRLNELSDLVRKLESSSV